MVWVVVDMGQGMSTCGSVLRLCRQVVAAWGARILNEYLHAAAVAAGAMCRVQETQQVTLCAEHLPLVGVLPEDRPKLSKGPQRIRHCEGRQEVRAHAAHIQPNPHITTAQRHSVRHIRRPYHKHISLVPSPSSRAVTWPNAD